MSNNEQLLDELRRLHNDLSHGSDGGCFDICGLVGQAAERIEGLEWQVKAYDYYIRRTGNLPDCNTCGIKKDCEYAPGLGDYVRVNCPLWRNVGMEGEG